ncbi:amidohydrolase family protein [Coralloluteibacterium thermophilus]|uniref:Amidohydrolase family protein n=1 Tax=Coralloluteibacterium thermophilum TaxID=2707049 RepID=A0ABV9NN44_9GAMM
MHARPLSRLLALLAALALPAGAATVIEGARVFDGERDLGEATILVEDGRIAAIGAPGTVQVPDGAERIDYSGRHIVPGLVANHAHVGNVSGTEHGSRFYTRENILAQLAQYQAFGVTTVVALGLNPPPFAEIRDAVNADPRLGASLFGAGRGVGAPDGAPPADRMNLAPGAAARAQTAEDAREAVRQAKAEGADIVKLWVDDLGGSAPMMQDEVYRAAIAEAHAQGLKVAAHIHDLEPARALAEAGVDIIAHGVRDQPVDPAFVALLRERGIGYIPTVNIDEANYLYAERPEMLEDPFFLAALSPALRARFEDPEWRRTTLEGAGVADARAAVRTNLRNLATLHAGGVTLGFGTDSGATAVRIPGFAEHRELELMTQAGLTPTEALQVATRNAAALMGFEDRGLLAPGRRADFVVLGADPAADILNTRRIEAVWQQGRRVAGRVGDEE